MLENEPCIRGALLALSSQHRPRQRQNRARFISHPGDRFKKALEKHQQLRIKGLVKLTYAARAKL